MHTPPEVMSSGDRSLDPIHGYAFEEPSDQALRVVDLAWGASVLGPVSGPKR